jgi:hypothetical protein
MAMRWGAGCDAARFIPGSNGLRHNSTALAMALGIAVPPPLRAARHLPKEPH